MGAGRAGAAATGEDRGQARPAVYSLDPGSGSGGLHVDGALVVMAGALAGAAAVAVAKAPLELRPVV
jgi:hypothetical protein